MKERIFHAVSGVLGECMFPPIGQLLELVAEHPDNEHWWEVRNEDGETGFVPASYVLIKEEQVGR